MVMGLQLVVRHSPILHRQSFGQVSTRSGLPDMGRQGELVGRKPVGYAIPVLAGAADPGTGQERAMLANGNGCVSNGVTVRVRLVSRILHHPEPDSKIELV